jgi:LPS O-antigen subunit length determinant protein (WzzB/FepE family)
MKKNNSYLDDEIDLSEIIKTLWNEKILILSISLFFMVVGYVYGSLQPKIYKTEITIREAPSSLFEAYRPYLSKEQQQQQQQGFAKEFNDMVKLDLSSLDTLIQFFENNNKINSFKTDLKEKKINPRNYFKNKFESAKNKSIINPNKYSLTYSQPLQGEIFLSEYIIFVQQQALIRFKQRLQKSILLEINVYKQHFKLQKILI